MGGKYSIHQNYIFTINVVTSHTATHLLIDPGSQLDFDIIKPDAGQVWQLPNNDHGKILGV